MRRKEREGWRDGGTDRKGNDTETEDVILKETDIRDGSQ